jgi:hypothetical protein
MPAGRKPLYEQSRAERLIFALRSGNSRRASCAYAGISDETLLRWLRLPKNYTYQWPNSKAETSEFVDIAEAVARAESEFELIAVGAIRNAAMEREVTVTKTKRIPTKDGKFIEVTETTKRKEYDWRAGLEWLQRRRPEEWKERSEVDVQSSLDTAQKIVGIAAKVAKRPMAALPESTDEDDS